MDDYHAEYLSTASSNSEDGKIAIHYFTYDDPTGKSDSKTSWARLYDGTTWTSQKLVTTDSFFRAPQFSYQGGRWHAAGTVSTGSTGGLLKTIYFKQKDDGSFSQTVIQNVFPKDYLSKDCFAVASDGQAAVALSMDTWTDHTIIFSEKGATANTFSTETVAVGGTNVEGDAKFVGYDQSLNPFIVYVSPGYYKASDTPQDLRILRKSNGSWTDVLVSTTGSEIGYNSFSAVMNKDGNLLMSYAITPVKGGAVALRGASFSLKTNSLLSEDTILDMPVGPRLSIYGVYTKTVLTAGGTEGLTVSSWVNLETWTSPVYTSKISAAGVFDSAKPYRADIEFVGETGAVGNSEIGAGVVATIAECDGQGNFTGKFVVRILPLQ